MCALPAAAGVGSWTVKTERDAMTDAVRTVATVTNAEGFQFSLYRIGPKAVWANFSVPASDLAILDSNKLLQLRVDKYPAQGLEGWALMQREYGDQLIDA